MRIAITGASGLLGRALIECIDPKHEIVAGIHTHELPANSGIVSCRLDLTDADSIRRFVDQCQADVIIHAAAVTDVDLCEQEPGTAQIINAEATELLADVVRSASMRLVYISTDYVFDGLAGPYSESDVTNPINAYGRTKLEGELAVLTLKEHGAIIRSASFLGHGGPGRSTFVEKMLESLRSSPPLRAPFDQVSNVTAVDLLAQGIMRIVESAVSGVWHIAHPQLISRYDLALLLAEYSGFDRSRVERVAYDSLGRPARRPLRGGLNSEKAIKALGLQFPPLDETIEALIHTINAERK